MPATFTADEVGPPQASYGPDEVGPPQTSFSAEEVGPPPPPPTFDELAAQGAMPLPAALPAGKTEERRRQAVSTQYPGIGFLNPDEASNPLADPNARITAEEYQTLLNENPMWRSIPGFRGTHLDPSLAAKIVSGGERGALNVAQGLAEPSLLPYIAAGGPMTGAFLLDMARQLPGQTVETVKAFKREGISAGTEKAVETAASAYFIKKMAQSGKLPPPTEPTRPVQDFTKPSAPEPARNEFAEPQSFAPEEITPPEPSYEQSNISTPEIPSIAPARGETPGLPETRPAEAVAQPAAEPLPGLPAGNATGLPVVESTAARFAREQREASRGMARMRQRDELTAAVEQVRQDILKRDAPVPESAATLAAQADLVAAGTKPAMLVTPDAIMPAIPEGHTTFDAGERGVIIFDPRRISPEAVSQAVDSGQLGSLLGYGSDAKPGDATAVLQTKNAEGIPVQEEVVSPGTLPSAIAAAQNTVPGGTMALKAPEEIIAERQAAALVTERHLKEARQILAQTDRPPDVLDDVAENAAAGVKFPADFKRPLENARGAARELASTSKGAPADDVLQRLALANPKYAEWTVDDLAQAMLDAGETRINQRKPSAADVQRVAEDLARMEQAPVKYPEATDEALQPFEKPTGPGAYDKPAPPPAHRTDWRVIVNTAEGKNRVKIVSAQNGAEAEAEVGRMPGVTHVFKGTARDMWTRKDIPLPPDQMQLLETATAGRLDTLAQTVHGKGYADLEGWQQDAIRQAVERGTRARALPAPAAAGAAGREPPRSAEPPAGEPGRPLQPATPRPEAPRFIRELNDTDLAGAVRDARDNVRDALSRNAHPEELATLARYAAEFQSEAEFRQHQAKLVDATLRANPRWVELQTRSDRNAGGQSSLTPAERAELNAIRLNAEGQAAPDRVERVLTRAIDALAQPPGLLSDPLFIQSIGRPALRGALQIVRASYRAGKQLAEAIGEGIKWLKEQGKAFDESEARAWLEANAMPARPGEGQNTHRFVSQLEASPDLTPELKQQITERVYDVRRQQDAAAAAQLILSEHGPDRAAQLFLDPTIAIPGDVRSKLAQSVIINWSDVERGMMMDPARRAEAEAIRSKNADFANAVMGQQTDSGQAISAWKGFWQQTPEGMVLAARRQIEGAGNAMMNRWTDLTQQVRQRLAATHDAAATDTIKAPEVQRVAREAVDEAVAADPVVRQAVHTEAHEALINDPKIRVDASKLAGADMTDVLNIVLDHFRFTGKDPRPLPEKLKAAGVPENYAKGFASSLEAAWKKKVADIEAALPKRIRNARLSAEVLSLAENIVRGLETQADAARIRLKEKFARMSAGVDPTIIADLSIIGAAHLGRATLDFAQWSARMVEELGDKVKPFLDEAWPASHARLAAEKAKFPDYKAKTKAAKAMPQDRNQPTLPTQQKPGEARLPRETVKEPPLPIQRKPGEVALPRAEPIALPDKALDKLIRAKLREKQQTLGQALKAAREDQLGQELGHAIVEQSGLKGPAAERLRDAINRRFTSLATARKEAELRKILKAQSEGRSAPAGMQRSWKDVVEWSNQGVLTNARWQEAIRQRLGVKRLSPEELQHLDKLARELAAIPAGEETRRLTASNKLHGEVGRLRANWWDLPLSVWFANALSGIQTHEINMYANLANFTVEAAILGRRAPLLASAALIRSLPEAGRDTLLAFTRGQTPAYRVGKIAAGSRLENLRGWENLALPLRYVFRALKGADLLFFVPAAEMKQAVAAKVIARQKGLRGEALARDVWETLYGKPGAFAAGLEQARTEGYTGLNRKHRAWEINLQKRSEALREAGSQFALDTTFNNSPYGFWGGLSDTVRAFARNPANGIPGKLSQLVAPFTPIISNVMNQGANLSPWGYARAVKAGWRMRNGKEAQLFGREATREDIADELVRATLGTVAMSAALLYFGADDEKPWDKRVTVHGQGPRDKGRRDALRAAGWIPNSLQIGKKFYSLEPYPNALPMAIVGNWLDAHRYQEIDQKSAMERLAYSLYQTRDTIMNRSFLSGLAQMLAIKDTPTRTDRQMTDALARMGANFAVPNFFRALDRWQDPKVYDEPGIRGALMAQVPWLRREGRPVLNDLGEPITRPLDKRWGSEVTPDPLWTFMAQHNLSAHASPDQDIGPFKMTEEQVYDFTRRRGQILRQMLEQKTKAGPPLYEMMGRAFDGNAKMTAALTQRFPALDADKLDIAGRAWAEIKTEAGKQTRKVMGLPQTPSP